MIDQKLISIKAIILVMAFLITTPADQLSVYNTGYGKLVVNAELNSVNW